jgi:chorismate dehydratase
MAGVLDGLRVGAVSYLNTRPLIHGLERSGLVLDVPARLADRFFAGDLDVALLPIFAVLRQGGGTVVDHVAIACDGPVFSVLVGSPEPLAVTAEVFLDPSSRSSAALLRVLAAEYFPGLVLREGVPGPTDARLLIGDPAITFHRNVPPGWHVTDLGAVWQEETGLPFVFAVWALRPGLAQAPAVAAALRNAKDAGLAHREEIAAGEADPDFARRYLGAFIHYDLGRREKRAVEMFSTLALRHGLLAAPPVLAWV